MGKTFPELLRGISCDHNRRTLFQWEKVLGKNNISGHHYKNSKSGPAMYTMFMFMNCFFSKVHPACHNIVNGIKPGSDSRKTDKPAVDCSKAV